MKYLWVSLVLSILVACTGTDETGSSSSSSSSSSGTVNENIDSDAISRGEDLYIEMKCSICHGADGLADSRNEIIPSERSITELTNYLGDSMPIVLRPSSDCTGQCASDIAAYIKSWDSVSSSSSSSSSSGIPIADCDDSNHENTPLRLLTAEQYAQLIRDTFSPLNLNADTLIESLPENRSSAGFNNNGGARVSIDALKSYVEVAQLVSSNAASNFDKLMSCSVNDNSCIRNYVKKYGKLLFRESLSDAEQKEFEDLANELGKGGEGIESVTLAMLISGRTLYHAELAASSKRKLSGLELANKLSFLLWNRAPDEDLLTAAEAGELDSLSGLREKALSMLNDSRANAGIDNFYEGWLEFNGEGPGEPEVIAMQTSGDQCNSTPECQAQYPDAVDCQNSQSDNSVCLCGADKHMCSENAAEQTFAGLGIDLDAAYREAERFASWLTLEQNGNFQQLLTSRKAFVSKEIAQNYDIEASSIGVDDYRGGTEVTLDSNRSGILTRLAYLMHGAEPDGSQPTIRGAFYRNHVLCQNFPIPGADVQDQFPTLPDDPTKTKVEKLKEFHLSVAGCAGCHKALDPLGFGFEKFDQYGVFRTEYVLENGSTKPVNDEGEIYEVLEEPSDIVGLFTGAVELSEITADSAKAQSCFSEYWFRYAFNRYINDNDQCSADKLAYEFSERNFSLKELILALVESNAFRYRNPD